MMTPKGSTPLVNAGRERTRLRAQDRELQDGWFPLIYLARFSGRPGHITIGKTTADLGAGEEPRLGAHTRGAGKLKDRLWVHAHSEIETRLHQAFREDMCEDEREWFVESPRIKAYYAELGSLGHGVEDWRVACTLPYLSYYPAHDTEYGGPGQIDIYGHVQPAGREIEDIDDYQTPHLVAEVARLALHGIGLDPSTSHGVNERVIHAESIRWAHPDHDGLGEDWQAETVYCNPPWSQDGIWARYMLAEFEAGHFDSGILAIGDTALSKGWWADFGPFPLAQMIGRPAWKQAWDGTIAPPCGGAFIYLGHDEPRFHAAFSLIAHVYGRRKMTRFAGARLTPTEQWDEGYVDSVIGEWARLKKLR